MISVECHATAKEADLECMEGLTDDELGLVSRTPKAEELLSDIDEHLRAIGMYSNK